MQVETNGVSNGRRSKYSEDQRLKLAEGYRAAEDKQAFADEMEIHPVQLRRWAAELVGPGRRGGGRAGKSRSDPAKPDKIGKGRRPQVELPAATSDLRALIEAVDGVRAALAPLPKKAALEVVEHLRRELLKG